MCAPRHAQRLAFVAIVVCSFFAEAKAQQDVSHHGCGVDNRHSTILAFGQTFWPDEYRGKITKAKVNTRQIEEAECLLRDSLLAMNWHWTNEWDTLPPHTADAEGYSLKEQGIREIFWHFRQYCGGHTAGGELLVFINAFCESSSHDDWRKAQIDVFDGGDCYWQAVINLSTRRVEYFEVNGDG